MLFSSPMRKVVRLPLKYCWMRLWASQLQRTLTALVRLRLRLSVQSVKLSTEPVNQNQINLREMDI